MQRGLALTSVLAAHPQSLPSPRRSGEKVAGGRMRGLMSTERNAPHSTFGHFVSAAVGRRQRCVRVALRAETRFPSRDIDDPTVIEDIASNIWIRHHVPFDNVDLPPEHVLQLVLHPN